jgi:hypothetical protein
VLGGEESPERALRVTEMAAAVVVRAIRDLGLEVAPHKTEAFAGGPMSSAGRPQIPSQIVGEGRGRCGGGPG